MTQVLRQKILPTDRNSAVIISLYGINRLVFRGVRKTEKSGY